MSKKIGPGMAYNMSKLNKIFFFLSLLLFFTTIVVSLKDFIRPWKQYQRQAMGIKKAKIEGELAAAEKEINKQKLEAANGQLKNGKELIRRRAKEIAEVEGKIAINDRSIKDETITNGILNSKVSALNFSYGQAHSHHASNAHALFTTLKNKKKLFAESKNRLKTLTGKKKTLAKALNNLKRELLAGEASRKNILMKRDLLSQAKSQTEMGLIFFLRNSPMLDFMDPTIKITQVVLDNLTDDRFFQHVPKVDRCMTCHTFIDQKGYENQANPFKTHPNLDLMVGAKSTHPMKKFGCTTCHGGEGHRVNDFSSPRHTPKSAEQKKEWIEKYSWHPPHHVPSIMFKKQYTEAGCLKCHKGVEHFEGAKNLMAGKRNIEKFGCYACHKIEGWEHKRKPGPSLEKIASKVDKEFFKKWVWDPKNFNKHAKMPSFFSQMNNSDPKSMKKNIAEVNAMADYVWSVSKTSRPFAKFQGGNKEKGKELIKSVGCMGCHGSEGNPEESKIVDAFAGPYLSGTGSKVDADWLVSWLIKPSHYQANTIMPSFRLSNTEANDIASYLMSLKNKPFEESRFEPLDKKLRDEILIEYFMAFNTKEIAMKKLMAMSDHEKTLDLGKKSVGKYGCYSCHAIEGFDGRSPIGPELSKVGSKPLTQFGFTHEKVEHSRDGWILAHLQSPRRWDNGVDKPFKDLLRMPNFDMSEKEAAEITTYLLGNVSDRVPLKGIKRLSPNEAVVAEGMKVVYNKNCVGCHQIDGAGGDLLKLFIEDDVNAGPPRLVEQGHRVKADWFHYFLGNVYNIRPWLEVRMPSFNLTNDEKNKIVSMFQAKADQETFEAVTKVSWKAGEREETVRLFKELDCASCHTQGFNEDEAQAPNLHYAKGRLRKSWIKKWLRSPEKIYPGTTMPSFWEDGEAQEPDFFGGDSEKQIEAITKYIMEIGFDRFPAAAKTKN